MKAPFFPNLSSTFHRFDMCQLIYVPYIITFMFYVADSRLKMLKKTYFLINLLVIFHTFHRVRAKFDHWCNYDMKPSGKCGVHLDELLEGTCGEGNFNSPDNSIYAIYGMPTMLGEAFLRSKNNCLTVLTVYVY